MHNFLSFNNLRAWSHLETEELDEVSEYFECISYCDANDKSCIRECRLVLD
jgi:hypothetical protein